MNETATVELPAFTVIDFLYIARSAIFVVAQSCADAGGREVLTNTQAETINGLVQGIDVLLSSCPAVRITAGMPPNAGITKLFAAVAMQADQQLISVGSMAVSRRTLGLPELM